MPISAAERRAIGLTLAGEIDPRMSPFSDPTTATEAANILATIENRFQANTPRAFGKAKAKSYTTRVDVAKQPKQYSTWNTAQARSIAKANYAKYGDKIDGIVDGFYSGTVKPSVPNATHYYSPKAMLATEGKKAPGWATKMTDVAQQGAHVFGRIGNTQVASLPETGPVPASAAAARSAMMADAGGLLAASPPTALGLLDSPAPLSGAAKAVGLLSSVPAAKTMPLNAVQSAPVARQAPITATPARVAPTISTPNAIAASSAKSLSPAQEANLADRLGPVSTAAALSPAQDASLADRLGPSIQAAPRGLLGSPRPSPGTMLTANAMVMGAAPSPATPFGAANTPVSAPAPMTGLDAEMDRHQANVAAGLALQSAPIAVDRPTPVARQAPEVASVAAPALPAPVDVAARRVAAVPAAVEAAQPAPQRQQPGLLSGPSAPATTASTGLGAPSVPDAPGFGAQLASRIGNAFSQNKGRMVGGLLGNVVGGPIGGLLGGYIGNRVQQGNTPQMSNMARAAIDDGYFDGFAHGPVKNQGLLGSLFGGGGLLGGGLGAPSMPNAPTGQRNYSVGGGGGPSMSSAAQSAMSSGGFDGFSHDGGGNKNTSSKSSSSKSGSKKK